MRGGVERAQGVVEGMEGREGVVERVVERDGRRVVAGMDDSGGGVGFTSLCCLVGRQGLAGGHGRVAVVGGAVELRGAVVRPVHRSVLGKRVNERVGGWVGEVLREGGWVGEWVGGLLRGWVIEGGY